MFRDLSVPSFKSDYSALTSTSGLRLFEWILNSCLGYCRARRACTPAQISGTLRWRNVLQRWTDGEDLTRQNPPLLKPYNLFPSWSTVQQTTLLWWQRPPKTRAEAWTVTGVRTGCTQDTLASAVNGCEIPESLTGTLFTESQTGLLCTAWSDYIGRAITFRVELT